jgi:hypothetical protein
MKDFCVAIVGLTVVTHFAFLAYLVSGGFVALRWPRSIWLHVPVVVWGIGSVALHFPCPLTSLERSARAGAGMGQLPPEGFIDHYITGVLYPAGATGVVAGLVFSAVCVSWIAFVVVNRRGPRHA